MGKRIIFFVILFILGSISLSAKEKLHLKVGSYENSPKIFTDENGEVSGFWADITNYIAQQEDWEIQWIHGTWDQCLQRLENYEIDLMVDVGVTPSRQERFALSDETVHLSWTRIYKKKGSDIQTILDLEGKKIAGLKGSFDLEGPEGLKAVTKKFLVDCEILEMEDYLKIFQALENNEIDAGIIDKDFGNINDVDFYIEKTPIILQPARMQFAFPKESSVTPYLIGKIDLQIKELKKDKNSIYYKSIDKYLGGLEKVSFFPFWLKIIILIILLLAIIFFVFVLILKHQVNQKTRELRLDITKRKQLEENLIKSEKKYRSLAETSSDLIVTLDLQGKFTYISPAFEKITGYQWQDFLGHSFIEMLSPEYVEPTTENFKMGLTGEKAPLYEVEILHKDGRRIPVELHASNLFNKEGKIVGRIAVVRDITERKTAEKALRESEKKLRNFMNLTPIGIWCFKPESPIDITKPVEKQIDEFLKSVCIECNKTYAAMMGTTKDKCIGIVLSEILPDCEETRKYFREFIRGGYKLVGGESHEISKTGEEKYFSNSFTATIINDMIIEAWGTQTDITERKQAEEELKTKMKQLEIFNDASVGRELRMLELKKEINELLAKLGKEPKYEIPL